MEPSWPRVACGFGSRVGSLRVSIPNPKYGLVLDDNEILTFRTLIRLPPFSFLSEPLKLSLLAPSTNRAAR